jgi:hypothetical protein
MEQEKRGKPDLKELKEQVLSTRMMLTELAQSWDSKERCLCSRARADCGYIQGDAGCKLIHLDREFGLDNITDEAGLRKHLDMMLKEMAVADELVPKPKVYTPSTPTIWATLAPVSGMVSGVLLARWLVAEFIHATPHSPGANDYPIAVLLPCIITAVLGGYVVYCLHKWLGRWLERKLKLRPGSMSMLMMLLMLTGCSARKRLKDNITMLNVVCYDTPQGNGTTSHDCKCINPWVSMDKNGHTVLNCNQPTKANNKH